MVPAALPAGAFVRGPCVDAGYQLRAVRCNGLAGALRTANSVGDAGHVGLWRAVFFYTGVFARSYMLAAVLLVGAARCLLAGRPRHWLAMGLLALAINAHFFAIPVAAGIFVWFYWLAPVPWEFCGWPG